MLLGWRRQIVASLTLQRLLLLLLLLRLLHGLHWLNRLLMGRLGRWQGEWTSVGNNHRRCLRLRCGMLRCCRRRRSVMRVCRRGSRVLWCKRRGSGSRAHWGVRSRSCRHWCPLRDRWCCRCRSWSSVDSSQIHIRHGVDREGTGRRRGYTAESRQLILECLGSALGLSSEHLSLQHAALVLSGPAELVDRLDQILHLYIQILVVADSLLVAILDGNVGALCLD